MAQFKTADEHGSRLRAAAGLLFTPESILSEAKNLLLL
jgi:hypothetical protein